MDKFEPLVSALGACGLTLVLAKYALSKAISDLDKLHNKVAEISVTLAAIAVRLEKIAEHESLLRDLQRHIFSKVRT